MTIKKSDITVIPGLDHEKFYLIKSGGYVVGAIIESSIGEAAIYRAVVSRAHSFWEIESAIAELMELKGGM